MGMTISTMSYAEAACMALREAMKADPAVIAIGEDLGRGGVFGQYRGLREEFGPDRIIDTPISEANIMGSAVGMALAGIRPVVEMRVIDFALCAMDEIVNQAAKNRYMFGGQGRVPLVARMPIGIWSASAAQHSQSLEAWFAHMPGLVVVAPATPADNYGLLKSSMASDDPVIYMEHKELWGLQGEVDTAIEVPIGKGKKLAQGNDLTIVTWSRGVGVCQQALADGAFGKLKPDLIDLRSIWPWDKEMVFESAARTGRLLVVHEAIQVAGFGAEVAAATAEATACKVKRLGAPRIPVGYAQILENESRLSVEKVVTAANSLFKA
jgi:pyruvate dehydrogenase E1 component beta subunit